MNYGACCVVCGGCFWLRHSGFRIADIGAEREQEEERAEHILALRNPGDRLDMQGMQREQRRHHEAAPEGTRHPPQQQEQQQRIGDMKPHTYQVLCPRLVAEELKVQHVGDPGQRMPVTGVAALECPGNVLPLQAALNVRVRSNVIRVVVVDVAMTSDRQEYRQRRHRKQEAENFRAHHPLPPWTATGHPIVLAGHWCCRSLSHCRASLSRELNESSSRRNEKATGLVAG